ncbi:MAG: YeeE/YedE thiosulfate transporter family protein [Pseudomonadales bacterium]
MIDPWLKLTLLMSVAGIIGYIAQRTGLCMIRGVTELRAGKPTLLLAMLSCGVLVWLFVPLAKLVNIDIPHVRYDLHIIFALGGLIFGLGTSANGGCSVSTISRLARGDFHMLATVLGWVVGWSWWLSLPLFKEAVSTLSAVSVPIIVAEFVVWLAAAYWAIKHSPASRRLWISIMAVGLLAGLMFLLQPNWSPSDLVQSFASAALHDDVPAWPERNRYLVLLALLTGMVIAAWITRRFALQRVYLQRMLLHFAAGVAMGLGACMAMGGNDTQLLLALPAASPGAILAIAGMLTGIYIGVVLRQPLARFRQYLGIR